MNDRVYRMLLAELPEGSLIVKEYQPWGECATAKTPSGEFLYRINGVFMSEKDGLAVIKDTWRPVSTDDVISWHRLFGH